jgi:DnaK suppressor protein
MTKQLRGETVKLTKKNLVELKDKIQAERERVLTKLAIDEEMFIIKTEDRSDEIDQATADYQRSQMLRFRNRDAFYAKKLKQALAKMAEDDYGLCTECDSAINFKRLLARPTAELCITCKDEAEKEESSNIVGKQSKSLGTQVEMVKTI